MFFKILVLIVVLIVLYFIFFNKSEKKNKKHHHKNSKKISGETMLECSKCGTFVSANEAIIKDGKYYCSTECANDSN